MKSDFSSFRAWTEEALGSRSVLSKLIVIFYRYRC